MVRVILSGCCGKMGCVITEMAQQSSEIEVVAGIDLFRAVPCPYPVFEKLSDCTVNGDVLIDFTRPDSLPQLADFIKKTGTPTVIATTGYTPEQRDTVRELSSYAPIFTSGNMSLGINLMVDLIKTSAKILGDSYDIEILEKHHNQKVDAPSGTALMLADAVNDASGGDLEYIYDRHSIVGKRGKREIGIHSIRGGTIVGEHTVIFAGHDEFFEITHKAQSRQLFAVGAIKAAVFLAGKPAGMYSMNDVISKDRAVTQAYISCEDAIITVSELEFGSPAVVEIFRSLADAEINIDMISQPTPQNGQTVLSFSLPLISLLDAVEILESIVDRRTVTVIEDVCKLSVEGIGMEHQHGAAAEFFSALDELAVPIYLITTSEVKIACCIPRKDADRAIAAIKRRFSIA